MQVKDKNTSTGDSLKVLIPVDFSTKGNLALKVGFELARRLEREVTLLHASILPDPELQPQFPDDFNGLDNENYEIEEVEMEEEINAIDQHSFSQLQKRLKKMQASGDLPDIKFNTLLSPGMPEEVIAEYCSSNPPSVIVMATRGKEKRKIELVGSVTAEVIDHAIAPVFTVPEDYTFTSFKDIVRICAFCYFDEGDFKAISLLMDMFGNPEVKIFLFPATDKIKGQQQSEALENLLQRLKTAYPNSEFAIGNFTHAKNIREQAEEFFIQESVQMILAPNRKRNALSRFFNPGLPHKILYEIDFPMLAIPV